MVNSLNLEEQEQLDQLKHFWAQYGNLITWALIAVLGSFAAWNGWNYWQRSQSSQAAALFDEIERASGEKDLPRVERALKDLKDQFGGTGFASQGALLAARTLFESGKADGAAAALAWVIEKSSDDSYRAVARLRLAGVHLEAKAYDDALKVLEAPVPTAYEGLAADRRGDVLVAQGKRDDAKAQYQKAWDALGERSDYRQLVQVKLAALGVDVSASPAATEAAR
jgi:predicted negative regulator of RcsB-dependent stress response